MNGFLKIFSLCYCLHYFVYCSFQTRCSYHWSFKLICGHTPASIYSRSSSGFLFSEQKQRCRQTNLQWFVYSLISVCFKQAVSHQSDFSADTNTKLITLFVLHSDLHRSSSELFCPTIIISTYIHQRVLNVHVPQ